MLNDRVWTRRSVRLFGMVVASALLLTGCGSANSTGGNSSTNTSSQTSSTSNQVVHMTFWSWVPGIKQQVALFNASHPNIQVTLDQTPTGAAGTYAKMFAAIKAGDPPDVGQIEFDVLPSFVQTGGLLDLSKYGVNQYKSQFPASIWSQVNFNGGVYAVPQATGPTGLFYNATLFKKYGLSVPNTWAQFASEAESLHKAHPKVYLTNFDTDPSWLAMFVWQAGGKWFDIQNNAWKLGFTSGSSMMVANYWQKLINDGAAPVEPSFNSSWYHQLSSGQLLTWPTAQWGAAIMQGSVPGGSGNWKLAPMPQWTAGANSYAQYGGSTTAVFTDTKHPKEATEFAEWMNTDLKSINAGVVAGFGWPAATNGLNVSALKQTSSYFGSQEMKGIFTKAENDTLSDWTYGPDYSTVLTQMGDHFKGLSQNGSITLSQVMSDTQKQQLSTLKGSGINVVN